MNDILDQVLADPTIAAIGGAVGAALVALWLAAAWWAFADAGRRTDSMPAALCAAGWIIVSTPLMVPFSLAIYALARPHQTASEHRTRMLAAELVGQIDDAAGDACRHCRVPVDPAWLRCPSCAAWLAEPCAACGSWSDGALPACPYCGSQERADPEVEPVEPAAELGRPRRGRRAMRAIGPGLARTHRGPQRRLSTPDGRPLAPLRNR